MSPDDLRDVYYWLLVQLPGLGVLEADQAALGLVARDAAARWWEVEE